jgi:small-conductance mechanosensitive channel
MIAFEWVLVILVMIPAALICWAVVRSGEAQRTRDQWRALRPATRHRLRKLFLVVAVSGTAFGVVVTWAFSTGNSILGLTLLVGLVVLNGIAVPVLRIKRKSTSSSSEAKKSR